MKTFFLIFFFKLFEKKESSFLCSKSYLLLNCASWPRFPVPAPKSVWKKKPLKHRGSRICKSPNFFINKLNQTQTSVVTQKLITIFQNQSVFFYLKRNSYFISVRRTTFNNIRMGYVTSRAAQSSFFNRVRIKQQFPTTAFAFPKEDDAHLVQMHVKRDIAETKHLVVYALNRNTHRWAKIYFSPCILKDCLRISTYLDLVKACEGLPSHLNSLFLDVNNLSKKVMLPGVV